MKNIRFIGDIHGKLDQLDKIVDHPNVVQIGDFGMGFQPISALSVDTTITQQRNETNNRFRFIRGNHDDPAECAKSMYWIKDGTIEDNIMYIGGGLSIDKEFRTPGISWWDDEELSIDELYRMIELYELNSPEVMVTHECPESIANHVMIPAVSGHINIPSRTRDAFEVMLAIKPPKIWIFGHWHHSLDWVDSSTGTRFICLNELEYKDLEV